MSNTEVVTLLLSEVADMIQFLLPVVAVCSVLKIVFDIIHNFIYNITERGR